MLAAPSCSEPKKTIMNTLHDGCRRKCHRMAPSLERGGSAGYRPGNRSGLQRSTSSGGLSPGPRISRQHPSTHCAGYSAPVIGATEACSNLVRRDCAEPGSKASFIAELVEVPERNDAWSQSALDNAASLERQSPDSGLGRTIGPTPASEMLSDSSALYFALVTAT